MGLNLCGSGSKPVRLAFKEIAMNTVDHKHAAPKLPGVVKSMSPLRPKAQYRASSVAFVCAAIMGIAGFYAPALFVLAAFVAFIGAILRFGKSRANFHFHVQPEASMFERELIAGSPEWQIRQIREGSY